MTAWREFLELRPEWDGLAAGDEDGVLLGHSWLAQCWKSSGALRRQGQAALVLTAWEEAHCRGVLALRRDGRRLCFLEEVRSQRQDMLAARGLAPAAWRAVAEYLAQRSDWDRLDLASLRAEGAAAARAAFAGCGLVVRQRGVMQQRRVLLARPWPEVEASLAASLRANYRRRNKRLQACGTVDMQVLGEPAALQPVLRECWELEQAGWKGSGGTAVLDSPGQIRFYRRLAYRLAAAGALRLCLLRQDGRLLAFEFCLADGHSHRLYSLKIGYDESYSALSPGTILRWRLLQHACERFASYEMLGEDAGWKAGWTPQLAPLAHLRVYNHTLRGQAWLRRAQLHAMWSRRA